MYSPAIVLFVNFISPTSPVPAFVPSETSSLADDESPVLRGVEGVGGLMSSAASCSAGGRFAWLPT